MAFRIGTTRDLLTASGKPAFNEAAFEELQGNPDIEWEWIPEDVSEITPDIAARYDGLHVNLPRVTAASVARDDCRVKIIARNGVGFDTVDVAACAAKGITVTNTPFAIRRPVAVAALTLIFALSGKLFTKDRIVREGRWNDRVEHMGIGLTGRRLGLIGAGGIGRELIPLARPFFREVQVYDPYIDAGLLTGLGAVKCSFEELVSEADFVVVACPLNNETHHLMNAAAFEQMKPTACFINVARGPIHDEAALCAALTSGQIAAAGLDVTEVEPIAPDSPLLGMTNTIVTPHALCWTDECFEDIARTALRSIVEVSLGRNPAHPVAAGQ
ncbi:NAD(P)-dependent oxidoreductase [Nisaea sp.]|uniref:NAD(P)-dependent oxidoreductase n=1 Tax=Nisaea sp. TaxID=2024842 RepID=UPI0032EE4DE8